MRILFCSEQPPLPPLDDGIRLPVHALVRELKGRHDVRVVALYQPARGETDPGATDLRLVPRPRTGALRDAALAFRAEITRRPLRADSLARSLRPILRAEVDAFDPDVVHVVTGQLAAVRDALGDRPAVLAANDAWYRNVQAIAQGATGLRRRVYRREVGRVQRFERSEYARYEAVTVVTQQDAEALDALRTGLPLHVIPNGVDAGFFSPGPDSRRSSSSIVFHGGLYYAPNTIAARMLAEEIFPLVREQLPEATLTIVGRDPPPVLRRLDRPDRGVRVVANVDDIRPWLLGAAVYAAPMTTGTGIKNKVLEAMACGLPCVVAPRALQGLHEDARHSLILAETPGEFAAKAIELLKSPGDAERIGRRNREYVISAHDWSVVARRYEAIYRSVAEAPHLIDRAPTRAAPPGTASRTG